MSGTCTDVAGNSESETMAGSNAYEEGFEDNPIELRAGFELLHLLEQFFVRRNYSWKRNVEVRC